jgi:transcriptional regulator with XRE-family HTH domain
MDTKKAFGLALKTVRVAKMLTQEDFGIVSSRTYVSSLERGLKSITLEKLNEIASVLNIHPLTLVTLSYLYLDKNENATTLMKQVIFELEKIKNTH